jgi:hypothetical protein
MYDVLDTFISSKTGDKDMLQINGRIEMKYTKSQWWLKVEYSMIDWIHVNLDIYWKKLIKKTDYGSK